MVRVALSCQGPFLFNPARSDIKKFYLDRQAVDNAIIKYNFKSGANSDNLPTVFCLFGTVSSSNIVNPVLLRPDAEQFHKYLSVVPLALEWQRAFAFFAGLYGYDHLRVRVASNGGLNFGTKAVRLNNTRSSFYFLFVPTLKYLP